MGGWVGGGRAGWMKVRVSGLNEWVVGMSETE